MVLGIIRGKAMTPMPFFVTIRTEQYMPSCAGTLITSDVVVTAGHCLFDFTSAEWVPNETVRVGKNDFTQKFWLNDVEWNSCSQYIPHQNYDPYYNDTLIPYDIALIEVEGLFDFRGLFFTLKVSNFRETNALLASIFRN